MSQKGKLILKSNYCIKCGSLKNKGICSNKKCMYTSNDEKKDRWEINGVFIESREPITKEEAIHAKNKLDELFNEEFEENSDL